MIYIVSLYAGLLTLFYLGLSLRTVILRGKFNVPIGDNQNPVMIRAMRVHSNFAEYVPLALILFSMMEVQGASNSLIHGLCIALVISRIVHAYGVSQINENFIFRKISMPLTFTCLAVASIYLIIQFLR